MRRRSGILWLSAGLVLAILAGLLTFRLLNGVAPTSAAGVAEQETVPVVVAQHEVPMRMQLTSEDVAVRRLPADTAPLGAANTLDQVLGKVSKSNLVMGEVVLVDRLADPDVKGLNMLYTMPEDKILIALPGADLMSRTGLLNPGDKVDILYSLDVSGGSMAGTSVGAPATISALQNQEIQAIVMAGVDAQRGGVTTDMAEVGIRMEGGETAILLAVDPQHALVLKYLRDAGGILDFALRVPTNEQFMRTESVTEDYVLDRYQIDVSTGQASFLEAALEWPELETPSEGQ
jgi:pilus assembly protein CpaB